METTSRRRLAMLGALLLGFGVGATPGECDSSEPGAASSCPTPAVDPPADVPSQCPAPVEDPCWRYRIVLDGNPKDDLALRAEYINAFRDACYVSEAGTFDCWYKTWQKACEDAALIGEVSGNAPYDKGYTCQPDGAGNYWLQTGPDPAIRTWVFWDKAPRQTPLVEVDGVPTEVNGPYRNLPELNDLWPGNDFYCNSGLVGADGFPLTQRQWILQVNRNAHKNDAGVGEIHSDLAGFKWPCETFDEECNVVMTVCEEPLVLHDPYSEGKPFHPDFVAQVHHVVPMNDKRSCSWGTNSNKNAAVISQGLNRHLTNDNPPAEEVKRLNNAPAYTP